MQPSVAETGSDVNLLKLPAHVSKLLAKLSLVFGILYTCSIFPGMLYTSKVLSVVGILHTSKIFPGIVYTPEVIGMLCFSDM